MRKDFEKLSRRQQNILKFMARYMEQHGYPPTIREIGEATDINSTSVVNYNLNKLVRAGYLERSDRVSRGMRLTGGIPGVDTTPVRMMEAARALVPLVGQIVASEPVEVPDEAGYYYDEDDMIEVPPMLLEGLDPAQVFALRVKGDSMVDAMIGDGDIVIMRKVETARNGEMVAVWLTERGETTLKHFYSEGEQVRLQPAHPMMDPIYVPARHCQVRGKVLSVIRQMR